MKNLKSTVIRQEAMESVLKKRVKSLMVGKSENFTNTRRLQEAILFIHPTVSSQLNGLESTSGNNLIMGDLNPLLICTAV